MCLRRLSPGGGGTAIRRRSKSVKAASSRRTAPMIMKLFRAATRSANPSIHGKPTRKNPPMSSTTLWNRNEVIGSAPGGKELKAVTSRCRKAKAYARARGTPVKPSASGRQRKRQLSRSRRPHGLYVGEFSRVALLQDLCFVRFTASVLLNNYCGTGCAGVLEHPPGRLRRCR